MKWLPPPVPAAEPSVHLTVPWSGLSLKRAAQPPEEVPLSDWSHMPG